MKYDDFVSTKLARNVPTGIAGAEVDSPHLFPFQRDLGGTSHCKRVGGSSVPSSRTPTTSRCGKT